MIKQANEKEQTVTIQALERLKEAMVNEGLINQEQLDKAEKRAIDENKVLGKILIKSGFISEEKLISFIGFWRSSPNNGVGCSGAPRRQGSGSHTDRRTSGGKPGGGYKIPQHEAGGRDADLLENSDSATFFVFS